MTSEQVLVITEKLSSIGTKVDTMVDGFKELKENLTSNYVTKAEYHATNDAQEKEAATVKQRLDKLESAPARFVGTAIALIGVVIALLSYLHK